MGTFTNEYEKLLIVQYRDKPKASATIRALLEKYENAFDNLLSLEEKFDLDNAVGEQLDFIGKIVGISREVPFVVAKQYFGFFGHDFASPFGDKFTFVNAFSFKDKAEPNYTAGILNDKDFRFFIKAKIAKNYAVGKSYSETGVSIQKALDYLYDGKSYVVDNKDMTMTIYIDISVDLERLNYVDRLNLLPRPQGVGYNTIISITDGNSFGFADNINSKGFNVGYFANKII